MVAGVNALFEAVIPIIHEHEGRVDKFVGDGLLAVFGAPQRLDDHADQGLAAALAIERAVDDGEAGELPIGIGVNSGTVIAGNVGGAGRLEFSVIGDPGQRGRPRRGGDPGDRRHGARDRAHARPQHAGGGVRAAAA